MYKIGHLQQGDSTSYRILVPLERIEGFIGVANERKTHFGLLFFRHCADLCSVRRARILLRDLVNGEV